MAAPQKVVDLVDRFDSHRESYISGQYNETQVRREFIDPMFTSLGWDVDNRQGYAEFYKDVIHEDAIKVGGVTKAPDYCFRVGGTRKFFLEAKKPSVNIGEDVNPAYQLRRYGWSAKLPLSILTDFDEFSVYDCRVKPEKTDKASHSRILYLKYTDYADRWDEIAGIFSRDAVLKGSFDKYVESNKAKKGTTEVDAAFLQEIENWRELLARNIALRNPGLSQRELNFAIQQTIDRIVFLRICEDRGIESYGRLMALQNGNNVYERLFKIFYKADEKYNSGLFHFKREKDRKNFDNLTPSLKIDDKPLKDIFRNLYYPESPYEFSVLSADILGQVYEKFLGKVIRLTPGHQAKIEEKPEVRKAGGVYYTPVYIVDYIVKNTVGKLVEGKKAGPGGGVSHLRILDPACGSGSFLIGAYQFLLDWHRNEHMKNDPGKWSKGKTPRIYQSHKGEWRLTTEERKRILLNNIYGVDIDHQAVEVTKLSLLLKVLEGEDEQSISRQIKMFQERVLPDLSNNIKCGNSLIGPDFYSNQQVDLFNEEEVYRINAFDWNAEFPEIMKSGGFDAVIGNPPYVRQEALGINFKNYVKSRYKSFFGTADLYVYFIEKAHQLSKPGGLFGYICSNKFMRANYGGPLRDFLASNTTILQLVDFGELPVFSGAATFPVVVLTENSKPFRTQSFVYAPIKRLNFDTLENEVNIAGQLLNNEALKGNNWTLSGVDELAVFEKMKKSGTPLGEYVGGKIYRGILTGLNEAFVIDRETRDRLIGKDPKCSALIKRFAIGDYIRKYRIEGKERFVIVIPRGWTRSQLLKATQHEAWLWMRTNYPLLSGHLEPFEQKCIKRFDKGDFWWELRTCDYYDAFERPKIIYPDIAKESRATFDKEGIIVGNTAYIIPINDLYLLGILNSKLIFSYFKRIAAVLGDADRGGRLRWFTQDVAKIPIRPINSDNSFDIFQHDQMVNLVNSMLELNRKLAECKMPQEKELLKRQIESTDNQIDQLVYKLYDLTEEEIKIVESQT
jgi:predicted type IV restriction endonuclease